MKKVTYNVKIEMKDGNCVYTIKVEDVEDFIVEHVCKDFKIDRKDIKCFSVTSFEQDSEETI